ncbi:hypothetical protein TWF696_001538 [Orbilia brochopaga]|uniref:Uncharacterized protein n=1 Tax=Orbilia brochopaga TaxID=3140254 RepID=A0AAV9U8Y9_9PEZI
MLDTGCKGSPKAVHKPTAAFFPMGPPGEPSGGFYNQPIRYDGADDFEDGFEDGGGVGVSAPLLIDNGGYNDNHPAIEYHTPPPGQLALPMPANPQAMPPNFDPPPMPVLGRGDNYNSGGWLSFPQRLGISWGDGADDDRPAPPGQSFEMQAMNQGQVAAQGQQFVDDQGAAFGRLMNRPGPGALVRQSDRPLIRDYDYAVDDAGVAYEYEATPSEMFGTDGAVVSRIRRASEPNIAAGPAGPPAPGLLPPPPPPRPDLTQAGPALAAAGLAAAALAAAAGGAGTSGAGAGTSAAGAGGADSNAGGTGSSETAPQLPAPARLAEPQGWFARRMARRRGETRRDESAQKLEWDPVFRNSHHRPVSISMTEQSKRWWYMPPRTHQYPPNTGDRTTNEWKWNARRNSASDLMYSFSIVPYIGYLGTSAYLMMYHDPSLETNWWNAIVGSWYALGFFIVLQAFAWISISTRPVHWRLFAIMREPLDLEEYGWGAPNFTFTESHWAAVLPFVLMVVVWAITMAEMVIEHKAARRCHFTLMQETSDIPFRFLFKV